MARAERLLDRICLYFSRQFCVTRYLDDLLWRINAKKEEALIPFKAPKIANTLHWIVEGRNGRKKTTVFLRFPFLPYPQISNHVASDWLDCTITSLWLVEGFTVCKIMIPPLEGVASCLKFGERLQISLHKWILDPHSITGSCDLGGAVMYFNSILTPHGSISPRQLSVDISTGCGFNIRVLFLSDEFC